MALEGTSSLIRIDDTRVLDEVSATPTMIIDKDDNILFLNEAACALYHTTKAESTGKKCYQAISGLNQHCLDCLGDKMLEGSLKTYSCYKFNKNIQAVTYLRSQFVLFKGQLARSETIIDRPKDDVEKNKFSESLDFEVLFHKMSLVLNGGPSEKKIDEAIKTIAEYFDAARSYVYRRIGDELEPTHKFVCPGKGLENNPLPILRLNDIPDVLSVFSSRRAYTIPDKSANPKTQSILLQEGVNTLLWMPLYDGEKLYGFFGMENEVNRFMEDYALSSFSLNLLALIHQEELLEELSIEEETGLPTEEFFWITTKEKARSANKGLVLCEFDYYNFQGLNDFYGTTFGDELIVKTASALMSLPFAVTSCHLAERDQFIVLFEGTVLEALGSMNELSRRIGTMKSDLSVRFYLGFYEIQGTESERQMKMKISVTHRYAREHPALPYVLYSANISERNELDLTIVNNFPKALEKEEFVLYVQPKYDMESKSFYGGEVLVRWDKDGTIVPPGDFIPVLERNGLITRLDRYVFLHTLAFIRHSLDVGAKIAPLAVNLSRIDFLREDWALSLLPIIDVYKIPHDLISFEITESAYVQASEPIIAFLSACKKMGIAVAMDDFGSGESSLNSLKTFDITCLKMDYKFFRESPSIMKKNSIILSVIGLAKSLGLDLVVEGIDNKNDAAYLYSLGANKIQGFYFARPMPIGKFIGVAERKGREIGLAFDESIYSALQNSSSPLFHVFQKSIAPLGLFRFDGKQLLSIMQNDAMHSLPFLAKGEKTGFDLFSVIDETDKASFISYIENLATNDFHHETQSVVFDEEHGKSKAMVATYLVHKEKDAAVLFVEIGPTGFASLGNEESTSFHMSQISNLFDSAIGAVAFLDEGTNFKYFNKAFQKIFPTSRINEGYEAINEAASTFGDSPFSKDGKDTIIYLLACSSLAHFVSRDVVVDGVKGHLLFVNFIEKANNNEEDDRGARIEKALFTIVSSYTDVNLLTGSFSNGSSVNRNVHISSGEHEELDSFIKRFAEMYVAEEDSFKVINTCSLESLRKASESQKGFSVSFRIKNRQQWQRMTGSFSKDVYGNLHASMFCYDATSDYLKDYDSLTGALNRNEAKNRIDDYVLNHFGKICYLGILDLDSFKSFNDRYGHPLGDEILEETAKILNSLGKGFDFVSRLGGDEFSFFYHNDGARLDINEVRQRVSAALETIGKRLGFEEKLDASIGFAEFPLEGFTYDDLYHRADESLYEIKAQKKIN